MTTPMVMEANCTTGEVIERPLNAEELANLEIARAEAEAKQIEQETAKATLDALKASAKAKLIAGEPLTAEEADTLVI
jgi:hypothetical protein